MLSGFTLKLDYPVRERNWEEKGSQGKKRAAAQKDSFIYVRFLLIKLERAKVNLVPISDCSIPPIGNDL